MSDNPFKKYSLTGLRTQPDFLRAASPTMKIHKEMMMSAADTIEQLEGENKRLLNEVMYQRELLDKLPALFEDKND